MSDPGTRIQRAMGGGRPSKASGRVRAPADFYPTPMDCTVALMRFLAAHEPEALNEARLSGIAEPACGDGAMARVLEAMGFRVDASDLVDRGWGRGGVAFLSSPAPRCRTLITNPPFQAAEAFIARARAVPGLCLVALLLPAGFWFAAGRAALFEAWRPSWILHMTWRPDFTGGGASTMQLDWCVWSVWSRSSQSCGGEARTRLLPRPAYAGGGLW